MLNIHKQSLVYFDLGYFYLVKGDNRDPDSCQESYGCDTVAVSVEEIHSVRCCSDVNIAGWRKEGTCDVWAASDVWGQCHEMNWSDARKFCQSQSGRLCTRTELEKSCSSETGCSYDRKLVWSSTPASDGICNLHCLYYYNHFPYLQT